MEEEPPVLKGKPLFVILSIVFLDLVGGRHSHPYRPLTARWPPLSLLRSSGWLHHTTGVHPPRVARGNLFYFSVSCGPDLRPTLG